MTINDQVVVGNRMVAIYLKDNETQGSDLETEQLKNVCVKEDLR